MLGESGLVGPGIGAGARNMFKAMGRLMTGGRRERVAVSKDDAIVSKVMHMDSFRG